MSALMPQIKSHRAMADALEQSAQAAQDPLIQKMLRSMGTAHQQAAEALEAGQAEMLKKFGGS